MKNPAAAQIIVGQFARTLNVKAVALVDICVRNYGLGPDTVLLVNTVPVPHLLNHLLHTIVAVEDVTLVD